jgi:hypothetical protein
MSVMSSSFDFANGGKLPGLYGGAGVPNNDQRCSGGRRNNCFSTRMMWRKGGDAEAYVYMSNSAGSQSKDVLCAATRRGSGVQNLCVGSELTQRDNTSSILHQYPPCFDYLGNFGRVICVLPPCTVEPLFTY